MAHSITITISAAAQRAALLAGLPASATQSYEVPQELLPQLLQLHWSRVDAAGVASCCPHSTTWTSYDWTSYDLADPVGTPCRSICVLATRPVDAAAAIAAVTASLAEAQSDLDARRTARVASEKTAERENAERVARWVALPLAWRASENGVCYCRHYCDSGPICAALSTSGVPIVHEAELKRLAPGAWAEAQTEAERLAALAAGERAARQAARISLLRALVLEHGPEDARDRIALDPARPLGALAESEAVEIVRNHYLPRVGIYRRLTADGIRVSCECADPDSDDSTDAEYDTLLLTEALLTAAQLVELRAIEARIAPIEGTRTVRVHRAQCRNRKCPAWPVTRIGIRVTRNLGDGLEVSREYGA